MKRFLGAALAAVFVCGPGPAARADDKDAKAVLDKAIDALGGEAKLRKALGAATWRSKGAFTFGDNRSEFTGRTTVQGLDRYRAEFEGEFNGNAVKGLTVVNGSKGWRKFGDMVMDLDGDALANQKRAVYLQVVPATLVPLKGEGFKVESAGEEKVGDAPAVVLKVTGPDGKDFKLFFDKESGLPVKVVATVTGFNGQEFTQETIYSGYKDFDGIKRATKVESRRDGTRFMEAEFADFKVLDQVDPDTFAEPK